MKTEKCKVKVIVQCFRLLAITSLALVLHAPSLQADECRFGFSKVDVTPTKPLRLSGFASRKTVSQGVDESIFVRALVIENRQQQRSVLISLDSIGVPGAFTARISTLINLANGIPRERIIIACSHSHCTPHLSGGLSNLFSPPMTPVDTARTAEYTSSLEKKVVRCVDDAVNNLAQGSLFFAQGEAHFARSRRRFVDGKVERLEHDAGPVDTALPILKVVDASGRIRGVVFNYACHCTTIGGKDYNKVNGDWAGYACGHLERQYPGAIALCTIGCGGDINPLRSRESPEKALGLSQAAGLEIAEEVRRLVESEMTPITQPHETAFGYAILTHEPRDAEFFRAEQEHRYAFNRQRADCFLQALERGTPIPTTYQDPIHVWKFGDQLTMVFMGGEVVIDYTLQLKREFPGMNLWVSSYCDDVFAYVASERIRKEGSYEADRSMVYYMRPSPWVEGTEKVVIEKVLELAQESRRSD